MPLLLAPMVSRLRSSDLLLRIAQFGALALVSFIVVAFLRYHLKESAQAFRNDFERQSFVELSRGETFAVARKLAALGRSDQISCVKATKNNLVFFEEHNAECSEGFFRVRETVRETNQGIEINFTLRIPDSLFHGLLLFLAAQALLASFLFISQRRLLFLQHEHEFAMASLAQEVAHDIKSPLAILKSRPGGGLERRALDRLESLVDRLQGRGSPGKTSLRNLLACAAQEKQLETGLITEVRWNPEAAGAELPGDSHRWRAAISNLLNNAHEAGATKVNVTLEWAAESTLRIQLKDNGRGISAEILSRLGARGVTEGKAGGKGLGFSGAKSLVEETGGRLCVSSPANEGATVTMEIPVNRANLVVLIDDDRELAGAWSIAAGRAHVSLEHFSLPSEFFQGCEGIPLSTPIYLDLDFKGSGESALEAGKEMAKKGFTQLRIATGRAKNSVSKPDWALEIVGKSPPWL